MPQDLVSLGAMAGVGQGLGGAGATALDATIKLRHQDQLFYLGMQQATIQLAELKERTRQSDLVHKRFYQGLHANELTQMRDIKAREKLESIKHDFNMEFGSQQNEAAFERTERSAKATERSAYAAAGARNKATRLAEQQWRAGQTEGLTKDASMYILSKLQTQDGNIMDQQQFAQFAKDEGFAGTAAAQQHLYNQWSKGVTARYGKDAVVPDFNSFMSLWNLNQTGDAREHYKWQEGVDRELDKAYRMKGISQSAEDIALVHKMGTDDLPIMRDADGSVEFDSGVKGQELNEWMRQAIHNAPEDMSGDERNNWYRTTLAAYKDITGRDMNDLDRTELRAMDLMFREHSAKHGKGRSIMLGVSGLSEPQARILNERVQGYHDYGSRDTTGSLTSTSANGSSPRAVIKHSGIISQAVADAGFAHGRFMTAEKNDDPRGALEQVLHVKRILADMDDPKNQEARGVNPEAWAHRRREIARLYNDMLADVSGMDIDPKVKESIEAAGGDTGTGGWLMTPGGTVNRGEEPAPGMGEERSRGNVTKGTIRSGRAHGQTEEAVEGYWASTLSGSFIPADRLSGVVPMITGAGLDEASVRRVFSKVTDGGKRRYSTEDISAALAEAEKAWDSEKGDMYEQAGGKSKLLQKGPTYQETEAAITKQYGGVPFDERPPLPRKRNAEGKSVIDYGRMDREDDPTASTSPVVSGEETGLTRNKAATRHSMIWDKQTEGVSGIQAAQDIISEVILNEHVELVSTVGPGEESEHWTAQGILEDLGFETRMVEQAFHRLALLPREGQDEDAFRRAYAKLKSDREQSTAAAVDAEDEKLAEEQSEGEK